MLYQNQANKNSIKFLSSILPVKPWRTHNPCNYRIFLLLYSPNIIRHSKIKAFYTLLIIPLFATIATPIKRCGRFICTSDLNLHKERSVVWALRTTSLCSVHVIPCISTTKNIINLFLLGFHWGCVNAVYVVKVRACGTAKSHSSSTILQQKQISTHRTEVHDKRYTGYKKGTLRNWPWSLFMGACQTMRKSS